MATAMAFPEAFKVGRKKSGETVDSINQFDKAALSRPRFVLRNNPAAKDSAFPQYNPGRKSHSEKSSRQNLPSLALSGFEIRETPPVIISSPAHNRPKTRCLPALAISKFKIILIIMNNYED